MAQNVQMIPSYTINGSFGELYLDGKYVASVKQVDAKLTIDKEEIKMASTRRTGYKAKAVRGEGTLTLYKVDSTMLKHVSSYMSNPRAAQPVFSRMVVQLDDPEALGVERVALKWVKLWDVPVGFNLDTILEEQISFTFEDIEFEDEISGDSTKAR